MTWETEWGPDAPLSQRLLRVAMTGIVHDDDPTVIADAQQELDRLKALVHEPCGGRE